MLGGVGILLPDYRGCILSHDARVSLRFHRLEDVRNGRPLLNTTCSYREPLLNIGGARLRPTSTNLFGASRKFHPVASYIRHILALSKVNYMFDIVATFVREHMGCL